MPVWFKFPPPPSLTSFFSWKNFLLDFKILNNHAVGLICHNLFSFLLCSMNAPVMVELEGETDPLEVI